MTWTAIPQAADLLASCAARVPETRYAKGILGPNDGALIYKGERVKKLEAIWRAEQERLFAAMEAERNYEAFDAHSRLSVQSAIATSIASFHAEGVAADQARAA